MDSILFEQSCYLSTVKGTAAVSVQNAEHVVYDVVGFYLTSRVVIVGMSIAFHTCMQSEPLFVSAGLEIQFAFLTVSAHHLWSRFLLLLRRQF